MTLIGAVLTVTKRKRAEVRLLEKTSSCFFRNELLGGRGKGLKILLTHLAKKPRELLIEE